MLSRRNTIASPSPTTAHATIRRNSRLRRSKTVSHPTITRSEILAPEERSQQAIAAAQRAYGDDLQRRKSQIVRFLTPPDNRYTDESTTDTDGDDGYSTVAVKMSSTVPNNTAVTAVAGTTALAGINTAKASGAAGQRMSYDAASSPEYISEAGTAKARRWSMQEDLQQQRFTPRPRHLLNLTATDAGDCPSDTGTQSSYRRLRKTKSVFSVGQVPQQPTNEYPSSVVYSSELSPEGVGSRRRSMSFLRGGTDFMPESLRKQYAEKPIVKERKSFYLSASARREQKPIVFPETVRGKKKEPSDEKELSVRKAVSEKARKMSASFFGTMRRAFGKQVKLEPAFPEQHVTSTRQHFRDYVSPNELHENILDIPDPNNLTIRPAVVSRAPTFRHVPSYEMLRSVTGSIGEATPPMPPPHRDMSVTTDSMSTWNATLDRNYLASKKRLSIIDENVPNKVKENIYSPPSFDKQQSQKSYEAKRVYSALMKRLDRGSPRAKKEEAEYIHGPGYYFAPGLGLRPEEEGLFERPYTAASTNTVVTAIRKNSGRWRQNSEDENESFYVPPVPALPMFYRQGAAGETPSSANVWLNRTPAAEVEGVMNLNSRATTSRNSKLDGITPAPLNALPTTQISTPERRLRVARSASTFFPYSSSVDEVVRESTPSPYRKATGVMDSNSSVYTNSTTTNTPPEKMPLPQRRSEYMHRSNGNTNLNVLPVKLKIKSGLKIKDYNPNWSRSSILATNENYNNTLKSVPRTTSSNNNNNGSYGSNINKPKNKENEPQSKINDNKKKAKGKNMLRSGSQGLGLQPVIYRSRSVLSQMSTVDIENAVNSQFGPVVAGGGEMGWKEASREKIGLERRDSPMVFL